ncbi:adenylate/guanylate cyclase domain-containing protein [Chitinimonas sp. BJB300]|uniref:ATP-binding protein n=1 Tax=Chitinimonas sp. BJB300 TaxID=1559339 RepID=UPI0011119DDC|nr:adenylate/guanylate cyclase domain-containing protein [Chitinimonas sp. BJB300]
MDVIRKTYRSTTLDKRSPSPMRWNLSATIGLLDEYEEAPVVNVRIAELKAAIATLDSHRHVLGNAAVDLALAPLREQLAVLQLNLNEQQLRQLTVLFLDVVGSTALSQHLDPEDINTVMDGALARFTALVIKHHGRVLQYAGDSLLAVFGLEASERAPELAVQAGLALLEEGRYQAARVLTEFSRTGFNVRVGIHTGSVLLGGGVDGENSIRGLAVNIAARMEQTAPAGGLRISRETYRHVRGLFTVEVQEPMQVKGCDEPLVSYLVSGTSVVQSQPSRGVEGLQVPLIGREHEMRQLQCAFTAFCVERSPSLRLLSVIGEAGMGKSRLLAEFRYWLAAQQQVVCLGYAEACESNQSQPYALLSQLFFRLLGLKAAHSAGAARTQWLAVVGLRLRSEDNAAVLGHLLGLDFGQHPALRGFANDARQLRDSSFFFASRLLRALADQGQPLLLLDDLHWADTGSLDFIHYLLVEQADLPLCLICLVRPSWLEDRPIWSALLARHTQLPLAKLDDADSNALAEALLQRLDSIPAELRALITEGADGNPFFMEERVNMLLDQSAIVRDVAGWRWQAMAMQDAPLPTTLTGVLQARMDALPELERRTLQMAAVVGPVFWNAALYEPDAALDMVLTSLVNRALIVERSESSLAGQREFAFKHHCLYQVCYSGVLKRNRSPAHVRVARWLAAQSSNAHFDLIAEHYERGDELVQAQVYWYRAADSALARYANSSALIFAERALDLLPADAYDQQFELCHIQVRALELLRERDGLVIHLAKLERMAELNKVDKQRSQAAHRRASFLFEGGDAAQALEYAQQALDWAPAAAPECAARAYLMMLVANGRLGRREQLATLAESGLKYAKMADNKVVEAAILNQLGSDHADAGDYDAAIRYYQAALKIHRETGHRTNEGGTLANLGYAAFCLGDFSAAEAQYLQALALCEAIGQRQNAGIIHINIALVMLNQAMAEPARLHASQALTLLRAAGDRWAEAAALRVAGQSELALGETTTAVRLLETSCDMFRQLDMPHLALEAVAALAFEALQRQDVSRAKLLVDDILTHLSTGAGLDGCDEPMRILLNSYEVLNAAKDSRATDLLVRAHTELMGRAQKMGNAESRQRFLYAVPVHRALLTAYKQVW